MRTVIKIVAIILIVITLTMLYTHRVQAQRDKPIVIVIDPGHGGKMTGAANANIGVVERDANLKIARYLRDYLSMYDDIEVIMTHDGLPMDYELELVTRGMIARNNNADMLISLHLNDSTVQNQSGAEVYVTANKLLSKYNQESTRFGNIVLNKLAGLGIGNRGVKIRLCQDTGPKWEYSDGSVADYYGVIRYPMKGDADDRGVDLTKGDGIPGVIIEHCFIKGNDSRFIDSEDDLKRLAKADCDAIVEFYGLELKDPKMVKTIHLDKERIDLIKGEKEKITATVLPDTAVNKNVNWSSNNTKVATISNTGEVTAIGMGTAIITATTQDRQKTATVTINVKEISIDLNKKEANLLIGNTLKVLHEIKPDTITNKNVSWSSGDESIATVDSNGVITALKEGSTTIKAKTGLDNKESTIKINVHKLSETQEIKISNMKEQNSILTGVKEKTLISEVLKNVTVSQDMVIQIKNKEGKMLGVSDYISTGDTVYIQDKTTNKTLQEYEVLIYGDASGDGKISALDYISIKNDIMNKSKLEYSFKLAGDINKDKKISALDYILVKNHIMGLKQIGTQ